MKKSLYIVFALITLLGNAQNSLEDLLKKYNDLQKKKEVSDPDMALFVELANTKEKLQETEAMLYMATRYPDEMVKIRAMMRV